MKSVRNRLFVSIGFCWGEGILIRLGAKRFLLSSRIHPLVWLWDWFRSYYDVGIDPLSYREFEKVWNWGGLGWVRGKMGIEGFNLYWIEWQWPLGFSETVINRVSPLLEIFFFSSLKIWDQRKKRIRIENRKNGFNKKPLKSFKNSF